jgi:uncharacterized protein YbbK (DUF523 family)
MENTDRKKPLVGISACLMGEHVRYDGGHKLDRRLRDILGKSVEMLPICPETECGLGIPREPMQLEEIHGVIHLKTCNTGTDLTHKMQTWINNRLNELVQLKLCGVILKTKSPSCGLRRVDVFLPDGSVRHNGTGLFALRFKERFPRIPLEDESYLQKDLIYKDFIEKIFALHNSYLSNK